MELIIFLNVLVLAYSCPCARYLVCFGGTATECTMNDYRGWLNHSLSGTPCKPWSVSNKFVDDGYGWSSSEANYCRSPRFGSNSVATDGVFCITSTTPETYERCAVPLCNSVEHQTAVCNDSCETLHEDSICRSVLDYTDIFVKNTTYQQEVHFPINRYWWVWESLSSTCRTTVLKYLCMAKFPKCSGYPDSPQGIFPCQDVCINVYQSGACNSTDLLTLRATGWTIPGLPEPAPFSSDFVSTFTNRSLQPLSDPLWNLTTACDGFATCATNDPKPSVVETPYFYQCVNYTGLQCSKIFPPGYLVAQNPRWPIARVEQLFDQLSAFFALADEEVCRPKLVGWMCTWLFPKCEHEVYPISNSTNIHIDLPVMPCMPMCLEYQSDCQALFGFFSFLRPSCGMTDWLMRVFLAGNDTLLQLGRAWSMPMYPLQSELYGSWEGESVRQSCVYHNVNRSMLYEGSACPAPLYQMASYPSAEDVREFPAGTGCALECPAVWTWTQHEWDTAQGIMYLNIPSFIFLSFLVLTWAIFPTKRKQYHVLWFLFSVWMVTLALVFGFAAPEARSHLRNLPCSTKISGTKLGDGKYCSFQAIILFYFMLSTACWWFAIIFNIYRRVESLRESKPTSPKFYHLACWGMPLLSLIIFVSKGELGGNSKHTLLFCFIADAPEWLEYFTWYAPIGILAFAGLFLVLVILWKMYNAARLARSDTSHAMYTRPLAFVLTYWSVLFWIFMFRVEWSQRQAVIDQSTNDFFAAIYRQLLIRVPNDYGSILHNRPTASVWYGLHFFLSLQGIVMVLTWGTQADVYRRWRQLIIDRSFRSRNSKTADSGPDKRGSRSGASKKSMRKDAETLEMESRERSERERSERERSERERSDRQLLVTDELEGDPITNSPGKPRSAGVRLQREVLGNLSAQPSADLPAKGDAASAGAVSPVALDDSLNQSPFPAAE